MIGPEAGDPGGVERAGLAAQSGCWSARHAGEGEAQVGRDAPADADGVGCEVLISNAKGATPRASKAPSQAAFTVMAASISLFRRTASKSDPAIARRGGAPSRNTPVRLAISSDTAWATKSMRVRNTKLQSPAKDGSSPSMVRGARVLTPPLTPKTPFAPWVATIQRP